MALIAVPLRSGVFQCLPDLRIDEMAECSLFGVAPGAFIGASNFFELAVATAIALFGAESGAALVMVVSVLIEVS